MKMEKDALQFMLDKLEKEFPGISNEIISPEDLSKYEKTNTEVINNVEQSIENLPEPQKKAPRPPRGTEITIDNQPYVYLGNDVAGMWAKVKEDGSVGSTVHTNHERLMKSWRDENFRGKEAELMQPSERDDSPAIVDQGGNVVIDVQTTVGQPKPPASVDKTPTLGPISPPPGQTSKAELGDPPPSGTLPNLDTSTDTTDQEGGVGGAEGEIADVTPADAETTPNLGRGTPPTPAQSAERVAAYKKRQAELKAEKEREEAERQAKIISDLEAEADAARAEAEARRKEAEAKRKAQQQITPNLSPDGPNAPQPGETKTNRINKEKLPGQTTDDGPVKFVPQDKLTKDQLDAIAGRGKYKVDKGADVKDQDPSTPGIQTQKPPANTDDSIKKAQDELTPNLTPTDNEVDTETDPTITKIDPNKTDTNIAVLPNNTTTKINLDTQKKDKLTKPNQNQKTPRVKGGIPAGGDNDDKLSDLMKFYPAKYADPLDLDKYKGGMAKARGRLSK